MFKRTSSFSFYECLIRLNTVISIMFITMGRVNEPHQSKLWYDCRKASEIYRAGNNNLKKKLTLEHNYQVSVSHCLAGRLKCSRSLDKVIIIFFQLLVIVSTSLCFVLFVCEFNGKLNDKVFINCYNFKMINNINFCSSSKIQFPQFHTKPT